jgi:hypothetical protein
MNTHLLGCAGMGNYVQISHLYQSVQNLHTRLEVQKIEKEQQFSGLIVISAIENNKNHQHHHHHQHHNDNISIFDCTTTTST